MSVMFVAHSFRTDTETANLGEDAHALKRVALAVRRLKAALGVEFGSELAAKTIASMKAGLDDVLSDASLEDWLVPKAEEAAAEAMVRPHVVKRGGITVDKRGRHIIVSYLPKVTQVTQWEHRAQFVGEPDKFGYHQTGYGATEAEAIADLLGVDG